MSASKSRKSKAVPLTILTAVALATTTACNDRREEVRDCVDAQNHIVPDGRCQTPGGGSIPGGGGGGSYHYTYGGASGGNIGDTVSGGSSAPDPGAEVVSEGVARGGFGHGGSGGEGE